MAIERPFSLATFPPFFILAAHISGDELHDIETECHSSGGQFTYDPKEARIFFGRITQSKRAAFELRSKGLVTTPVDLVQLSELAENTMSLTDSRKRKRTASSSSSESDTDSSVERTKSLHPRSSKKATEKHGIDEDIQLLQLADKVFVLKLEWLEKSLRDRLSHPIEPYIVYTGKVIDKLPAEGKLTSTTRKAALLTPKPSKSSFDPDYKKTKPSSILSRAQADSAATPQKGQPLAVQPRRRFGDKSAHPLTQQSAPKLMRTTTSEFEDTSSVTLPEPPEWAENNNIYSCQRSTPLNPVNVPFLSQLYKIKEARVLTLDEIGVRAYSTSIAALSAYPHILRSPAEILRLPGCDTKIAALFSEWHSSGDEDPERSIAIVRELDADPNLHILRLFFGIWGIGAETARKLYFERGFKDLDDIIEFGWHDLTRVQQIGLKYYEEFEQGIDRQEVEEIARLTRHHARKCRGLPDDVNDTHEDIEAVIVGGYRRGKDKCGDVDVVLSHRDEEVTENLIGDVISSLEEEGWITHLLILYTAHSQRGQATLPFKAEGHHAGHGFDSLDKALVVWQDIHFNHPETDLPTTTVKEAEKASRGEPAVKNPNPHRRVDIIITPWRTVGSAVLGWSGATTFERDIRRWCKREKAWKYDSSGVRDRATGRVIDLESPRDGDTEDTWQARERRLMEGLGIGWREPHDRCTG
ncbi:MAG: hypothetical protein Q9160_002824 [Pyrenula sp. 1 TL-2023]